MQPSDDNLGIMRSLKKIMDLIKHELNVEFRKMHITGTQGMIMAILVRKGRMTISTLSKRMSLSNSTVSGILNRLEQKGHIERHRSEDDRRVVYVQVTQSFRKSVEAHMQAVEIKVDALMKDATQEQKEKVIEGLSILHEVLEKNRSSKEEESTC